MRTRQQLGRLGSSRGASLIQVLVVLSILSTLTILVLPAFSTVQPRVDQASCRTNLATIDAALIRYRSDHQGQDPPSLTKLIPDYVSEEVLTCPVVKRRAPDALRQAREIRRTNPNVKYWISYFYFNRRGLDSLRRRGEIAVGYSEVLQSRRGETPVLACYDHREPYSLEDMGLATPAMLKSWYFPERAVLVLRRNHRVDGSRYGGVSRDGLQPDTLASLRNL